MAVEPSDYLFNALKEAEPELSNLWFSISNKFGWDKQASSLVRVSTNENGVSLTYNPDMSQKVFDTEYGYKGDSPKPAMREMANVSQKTISNAAYNGLSKYLKASGVFK